MRDDEDSLPVYRRGPERSVNYAENLEFFESTRELARRVPCGDCHQPAGQNCVNTISGEPLKRFPAHDHRIQQAKKTEMT